MPPTVTTGPVTWDEVVRVARRATDALNEQGFNCCVFGGTACSLWASSIRRTPGDVDIVVMTNRYDPEYIKQSLVDADDRFFTTASVDRTATYRKLYFRLPGFASSGRRIKVDILVPPTLEIPWVSPAEIIPIDGIPVMPLFPLLVLKLQGWWDHRRSNRADFRAKESSDIEDIRGLVAEAKVERLWLSDETEWGDDFMDMGEMLVGKFMRIEGFKRAFRNLGFNV
ncbi:hypothetical protein OF83DRAFT_1051136 [Amylostereum chailletii]|nr:hypothetical protein OF83DRAFT_1051136 [Amylostereum chailletii]